MLAWLGGFREQRKLVGASESCNRVAQLGEVRWVLSTAVGAQATDLDDTWSFLLELRQGSRCQGFRAHLVEIGKNGLGQSIENGFPVTLRARSIKFHPSPSSEHQLPAKTQNDPAAADLRPATRDLCIDLL